MSTLSKATLLFFAFVLAAVGLDKETAGSVQAPLADASANEAGAYLPGVYPDAFSLLKPASATATWALNATTQKYGPSSGYGAFITDALGMLCCPAKRMVYMLTMERSLSAVDLIFPFHTFW